MKRLTIILTLAAASVHADEPIYFYWTATGAPQYDAYFEYSSGTTSGGVFTPATLVSFSFGTPFGVITPATDYPDAQFFMTTPIGPAFNVGGTVTPVLNPNSPTPLTRNMPPSI
jgi:hypothetical protein